MMTYRRWNGFSFSMQTLMVAIALCCIALAWWQRSSKFEQQRVVHAQLAQHYADMAWGMQRFSGLSPDANRQACPLWDQHLYHAGLAGQYRRAAWLGFVPAPVEEQPPHEESLSLVSTVAGS